MPEGQFISEEHREKFIEAGKETRFKEGNPGGPGRGLSVTGMIKKKLLEVEPVNQKQYLELLVEAIMHKAVADGDEKMIKHIWNYVDGMPQQHTDITSAGKPIPILGNVSANNGNQEDSPPEQTN